MDDRFPFYFAIPTGSPTSPGEARLHIAQTFDIHGVVEHVSSTDPGFSLYRVVAA
jgi:hypothetical protein